MTVSLSVSEYFLIKHVTIINLYIDMESRGLFVFTE